MKTFEPWETYKPKSETVLDITVPEPPCKDCKFWKPERQFTSNPGTVGQIYSGVILCHAKDMHNDFSCYKPEQ